jgi:hypothetical protein
MKKYFWVSTIFSLLFFFAGLLTINHYGVSWDEPFHFARGQTYLWYFMTGQKNYKNLPSYDLEKAQTDPEYHARSFYQIDALGFSWQMVHDGDHPVLNDLLAAFSNYVFYQKLGILGDIQSFHVWEIFVSAVLVGVVVFWASEGLGLMSGLFSGLFLSTYPLFWAESHFNIKDPQETLLFTLGTYFLWKAIDNAKARFILLSSLFVGFAVSTKFNIIFLPFIVFPWIVYLLTVYKKEIIKIIFSKRFILAWLIFPFVVLGIFVAHWPYLWQDPLVNITHVISYYRGIGTSSIAAGVSAVKLLNFYAPKWIVFTTQPLLLVFFFIGIIASLRNFKKRCGLQLLLLCWFVITLMRVIIPGTAIYGGVRQIMEYLPAMSMIAGYGVQVGLNKIKKHNKLISGEIFVIFLIILVWPLFKMHPNENVYFNRLSGGLKGNFEKGLTSAGFSFGNAYLQGVEWINKNVEKGARVALVQGTMLNIPSFWFRSDINYSNRYWSGINRDGEYLIELTYSNPINYYPYAWDYINKFLIPVYEVKVDGVAIAKVWKNDLLHTKVEMQKKEAEYTGHATSQIEENQLTIKIGSEQTVSRVVFIHGQTKSCAQISGYIEIKNKNGTWTREEETIPFPQISAEVEKDRFTYYFPARIIQEFRFVSTVKNTCVLINPRVKVYILK